MIFINQTKVLLSSSVASHSCTKSKSIEQMKNIYKGQEVYYQYIGHRVNGKGNEPELTTVTKVGRKWFEVEAVKNTRFDLQTLQNDGKGYSSSSRVILSLVDYRNEREQSRLNELISEYFRTFSRKSITLEQLREIAKVLNIEPNPERSVATEDAHGTER